MGHLFESFEDRFFFETLHLGSCRKNITKDGMIKVLN